MAFDTIPSNATIKPTPFTSKVPEKALAQLKQLLELSPIANPTYENTTRKDDQYGVKRDWIIQVRDHWLTKRPWSKTEEHINSFPNYTVDLKSKDGETFKTHFVALFSERKDAVPVCLLHGWPGSFLEFLHYLNIAKEKYPTPKDLPYHFIVPSLTGYGFSEGPSLKREWVNEDMAFVMNELMVGLGFGSGYIAHGGDIGSFLARIMARRYDACKAVHLNFCLMGEEPKGVNPDDVTKDEQEALKRLFEFATTGNAYAKEHGTKGGTIGIVLQSSPIALLAWIAEKYIEWTDKTPSFDDIIDSVALYWLTETFPRCIYPYIDFFGRGDESTVFHGHPDYYLAKPIGYSYFPYELGPIPIAWAKKTGNLVWHKSHKSGGHFAAIEKPHELFEDQEEFIKVLNWKY